MHSASDEDWAEAVRREAVIRPLVEAPRLGRPAVLAAASSLGLSMPRIYRLVRNFRNHPVTASLAARRSGPAKGWRRLDPAIEARVEAALDAVYLKPERPTLKRLFNEVRQDCLGAGLQPPSTKALRARVTALSLRERTKAREGAAVAGNRFRQVKTGLRTERPLQVVQIDHTEVDIMLVDDVTRTCIGRPWLTLALDVHTRMVAGLTLALDPPSAAGAALAVTQAVLPKTEWEVLGPYHNEVHAALGRTPAAAWGEGIIGLPLREPADPAALLLDFLPFEERVIRRDGVRLFNVLYQDGGLAHLVDSGGLKLRVKYDPRDLSAVFVELATGEHVRAPYADIGRPTVTLWEHRLATKRLREEGWRTMDEHAIFAAVEEQRRVLAEANGRSKAARRAVVRASLAAEQVAGRCGKPAEEAETGGDPDAQVPMPGEGATSGVEFW